MIQTIIFVSGIIFIFLSILFFILSSTTKSSIKSGASNADALQKTSTNYNITAIVFLFLSLLICMPVWIYIKYNSD